VHRGIELIKRRFFEPFDDCFALRIGEQAQTLLNALDATTIKGLRDRAILAVLLGCGLRRSAGLPVVHRGPNRKAWSGTTVPMPTWVKVAIDTWAGVAGIADGPVFRSVNRGGQTRKTALSERVVWQLIRPYAKPPALPGIALHDCRRTCAKLCRAAGGELEQIQMLLGHQSVQTTERYLGTKQDLVHAPNDGIKLRVAV
jgi:integrase